MKHLLSLLICLMAMSHATAKNTLTASDVSLTKGGHAVLEIGCSFEATFTAFEFDLVLPEGCNMALDNNGKFVFGKMFGGNHVLTVTQQTNGYYKFICYSMSNSALPMNGTLVHVGITANSKAPVDEILHGKIKNIEVTRLSDYEGEMLDDVNMNLTVNFAIVSGERYYFRNVATQKFWGAGNSWGTYSSLVDDHQYAILTKLSNGKYTMETMVSNGNTNYYLNESGYMDGETPVELSIQEKVNGQFTVSANSGCFGWDGQNSVLSRTLSVNDPNALWELLTEDDVQAEKNTILASAAIDNPVDATFLIKDAGFGRNRRDGAEAWNMTADHKVIGGPEENVTNYCTESYHSTFKLAQVIENAPKGVYKMTAQGFYRQDGTDNSNLPYFYINEAKCTFPQRTGTENNMTTAGVAFMQGKYQSDPIFVQLSQNGVLQIGAELEDNTNLWCILDNFKLTYYGPNTTVNAVMNYDIINELAALRKRAEELVDEVEIENMRNIIVNALSETKYVDGKTAINAAIVKMEAVVDKAEASVIAKGILPKMKRMTESTNFYTSAALEKYYTQWLTKYEDATLTKNEALVLQDPFLVTGWHADVNVDDLLMSVWEEEPTNWDSYHINTWSVEGETDGTDFKVPFMEYWVQYENSLPEKNITASIEKLLPNRTYIVSAWVRVRVKDDANSSATGITMQVGTGNAVDVTKGTHLGNSPFYLKRYSAEGKTDSKGILTVKFNVSQDNNICWLAFKDVRYELKYSADPVTLVVEDKERYYGDDNPKLTFVKTSGETTGQPVLTCSATKQSPVGTYDIVISRGTVEHDVVNLVKGTLTIKKAPLTASVKNYIREEEQENPKFVINYSGWKNGENESVLISKPIATTTATRNSPSGDYPITISGGEAQNYEFIYIDGILTIAKTVDISSLISSGKTFDVYSPDGKMIRVKTTTLDGLPRGMYIINGHKVVK